MELTLEATFDGEVFRPAQKIDLEPDTKVEITVKESKEKKGEPYSFLDYAKSVSLDAPPDYATNIDKYLYGGMLPDGE